MLFEIEILDVGRVEIDVAQAVLANALLVGLVERKKRIAAVVEVVGEEEMESALKQPAVATFQDSVVIVQVTVDSAHVNLPRIVVHSLR